jgi:hypothetical protein
METNMEIETDIETETGTETETDNTRTWKWLWIRTCTVHGIGELLLSISYVAIVIIAPYRKPLKYHCAISNGAIYL